ncbi:MAG: glycosyltransferase [Alphaproteobacteria bacterium]|nr:glycosyltransferase [Alphaproteobacteria bacterium]
MVITPELVVTGLVFATLTFYVLQVLLYAGAMRRARTLEQPPTPMRPPRVSILKPLAGLDDELRDNLETFAVQRDVDFEILFGVASEDDPALEVAQDFVACHPEVDARILITDPDAGLNPKVAQLIGLEDHARGDIIVISDSNVRVHPDYVKRLIGELSRPGTAVVSNVIVGTGERSIGSVLENLLLATFQAPGVVAGWELSGGGGLAITIGKSMAIWRDVLHRVGGFRDVRNVLAEDQAIGRRCRALGYRIGLSFDIIQDRNVHGTIWRTLHRHARWAKTRRSIMPAPYLIEPLLLPFVFACVGFAVVPTFTTALFVVATGAAQIAGSQVFMRMLRGHGLTWRQMPLELVRIWVYFACWLAGWFGNHVRWRGHHLVLGKGAELVATTEEGRAALRVVHELEGDEVRDITSAPFAGPQSSVTTP